MSPNQIEQHIGDLTLWCRSKSGFSYEMLQKHAVKVFGCKDVDRYFLSIRDHYRARGSHHADRFDKFASLQSWFDCKAWTKKGGSTI